MTSTAAAQVTFDPNLGTPLGMSDDSISAGHALNFSFTFPGGGVVTAIDIDSNGRILPPGGDTSDFTESVSELLSQSASICPLWDDLNPANSLSDDVYFNAYNNGTQNVALVTWNQVVPFSGTTTPFTVQVQILDNNDFTFWWDASTPMEDGLVGCSPGGNASDPGMSNFNCGPVLLSNGNPTIYELFPSGTFDLQGGWARFTPDGSGGWVVLTPYTGTCNPPIPPAQARATGVSCTVTQTTMPVAIDWMPDGIGGYNVLPSAGQFDAVNVGTSMGHTDDSIRTAALGFPFVMPDGTTVTSVDVDSNGRVMIVGADTPDFSPTIAEYLAHNGGLIAPFWADINVNAGGDILFYTDNVGYATVTWQGAFQYSSTNALTLQLQLFSGTNSWTVVYENTGDFDPTENPWADILIGCTAGGNPTSVTESDLTALPILTSGLPHCYEYFDHNIPEQYDIQLPNQQPLDLTSNSLPILGQTFDIQLDEIAMPATGVYLLIGVQNLNIDLSLIGVPCFLYADPIAPAIPMNWMPGASTATFSLPITNSPTTAGIPLTIQGAVVNPGANPLNVELSNAVDAITGS